MNRTLTALSNDIEAHPLKQRDYTTLYNNLESSQELDMASVKYSILELLANVRSTAPMAYLSVEVSDPL